MNEQEVEERIRKINEELEKKNNDAANLLEYLSAQRAQALELETIEEEQLKKKGIIIGQHVPSLKSKLELDKNTLDEFGEFSSTLLIAKDLVDQNQTNFLRRTGNLPISDLAETRRVQSLKYRSDSSPDKPHYLAETKSVKLRDDRVAERFSSTLMERETKMKIKLESTVGTDLGLTKPKERKQSLSAIQKEENANILKGMNHKLNYLRNPRNDPIAVTKMLTKPKAHFSTNQKEEHHHHHHGDPESVDDKSNALSSGSTSNSKRDDISAISKVSVGKTKYGKIIPVKNNPLFVAEPTSVFFTDYNIGEKYSQTVAFRNVSAVTRSVHILAPKTPAFTLSPLKFPANSVAGMVAPGIKITATLFFNPDSLGNFSDYITVNTESGSFRVQIIAQREPPQLSIPSALDMGACFVGDAQRLSITCLNNGGGGRFLVLRPDEDIDEAMPRKGESTVNWACKRIPPFTMYPTEFTLMKGEAIDLTFEYVPLSLGKTERIFYIKCDNGQIRKFVVTGFSKQLNVVVAEINSVDFNFHDPDTFKDIFFAPSNLGSEQKQEILIVNDSGLAIEYEWIWLRDLTIEEDDEVHIAGQRTIAAREAENKRKLFSDSSDDSLHVGATPEKHQSALTKSIQRSLAGDSLEETDMMSNSAMSDEFEVRPARGVLSSDGAEKFIFHFTASSINMVSAKAVLMIKSIPRTALPDEQQQGRLQKLGEFGHGAFLRCRSWLEEIGVSANVEPYQLPNGNSSSVKKLISLKVLVQLLYSQIIQSQIVDTAKFEENSLMTNSLASSTSSNNLPVPLTELPRIDEWIRNILKFLQHHNKKKDPNGFSHDSDDDSVVDDVLHDDADDEDDDREPDVSLSISSFQWKNEEIDETDSNKKPQDPKLVPLILLKWFNKEISLTMEGILEFDFAEKSLLQEVWLDVENALKLIGEPISHFLNKKVQHEAVDYLKDCALNNYAGLSVAIHGEGKPRKILIEPPLVQVGGSLSIGKEWNGLFKLINPGTTMAEIKLDFQNFTVERLFAANAIVDHFDELAALPTDDIRLKFRVSGKFDRVLLMPNAEETVPVTLTVSTLGRYLLTLPLIPKGPSTEVDSLRMMVDVVGPRVHLNETEIDLGLVGVGSEATRTLTFINESDVPAMFVMKPTLHLDMKKSESNSLSRQSTHRDGGSTSRQSTSRMSTVRSDDYSIAESNATSTDFKIELRNAIVTVEPPSGIIAPRQTLSVLVTCKAGKTPQRIRGFLENRLYDVSGAVEVMSQRLNMRGEVQAPKTKMYPLNSNLGQVYVGMPVKFSVAIENICNLPTMFKLLRPGGPSSLYSLSFSPYKGPLGAKEKVTVECTFIALSPGLVDDVLSNKIFGTQVPLGFTVKAIAKGISLEFRNLSEGEKPPQPIAPPDATQFPGKQKPPEPRPTEPLLFGDDVPLYERKSGSFVIRNLSGIPVPYTIKMKKFMVIDKKPRFASSATTTSNTLSSIHAARDDLIIAPHEDGENKFTSAAGKKYIGAEEQRHQDRKFLLSGLGASYFLENEAGEIPPWGVQVIRVSAYNDIPGCYDDEMECSVKEGEIKRKFVVPFKMTVVGCPMVIEKNTVGMTVVKRNDEIKEKTGISQVLHMGSACINCQPLIREFHVKNHGSRDGKINWVIRGLAANMNGPLKLSLKVRREGEIKSKLDFWEDVAKDSPFRIEPLSAVVKPYSRQKFTITLFRTNFPGMSRAELTGSVVYQSDSPPGSESKEESEPTGANKFKLRILLQGDFHNPTLEVDQKRLAAPENPTILPEENSLNLRTKSTLLFASGNGKIPLDTCCRPVTLLNPMEGKLTFTVSTEGPFTIAGTPAAAVTPLDTEFNERNQILAVGSTTAVPVEHDLGTSVIPIVGGEAERTIDAIQTVDKQAGSVDSVGSSLGLHTKSSLGRLFNLSPQESCSFQVAFAPKKQLRESLKTSFGKEGGAPIEQKGKLIVAYSTGQTLHLPLTVRISTPFLGASSPRLYFGVCHTSFTCKGLFLLSNPTDVPAKWTVTHVVGGGAWRTSTAIRVKGFSDKPKEVDDPDVFEITPTGGLVEGPTVSVAAAMAAPPKDYNRKSDTIVQQRVVESSWASQTLSLKDSLDKRHSTSISHTTAAEPFYPMPLTVIFRPKKNVHYTSRFRFSCEFANSFDLVLQGVGTYEEHEHKPINPIPK